MLPGSRNLESGRRGSADLQGRCGERRGGDAGGLSRSSNTCRIRCRVQLDSSPPLPSQPRRCAFRPLGGRPITTSELVRQTPPDERAQSSCENSKENPRRSFLHRGVACVDPSADESRRCAARSSRTFTTSSCNSAGELVASSTTNRSGKYLASLRYAIDTRS